MRPMDFKDNKPIYLQISDIICNEILSGEHPEGERLPSVRDYAVQMEVNVNTVVRSFDWLSQQEIIFQRRGLGFFVSQGASNIILGVRKDEFFHQQLPELFAAMHTLGIGMDEVVKRFEEQQD